MSGHRQQKIMVQPIAMLFKFLQSHARVQVWLYEQVESRLEGELKGFDEFMNIVLDNAVEVNVKGTRREIGRLLLKGDNISLISKVEV
ncbi:putative small nuclear ribonucleo protein E (snRNP-E) [Nadsonia fulvescens var. elongata DSM 6958]|uniref:Small nuclear ribonucleoprotein E n=1 Tax=Nadsonia fulvescens var. elongata DSM 6958 TaxID=857566 RepID=A0A1E3PS12_9ASCO|nr:putative small nuclear ribonucleo protein E (snRNP-E) [Nadsonia fulvescens var. elongata DSM 6958]